MQAPQAKVVSNSSNKIHQTWGLPFSRSLYRKVKATFLTVSCAACEICITDRGSLGDLAADTVQAETQIDANLAAGGDESRANSRESGARLASGYLHYSGRERAENASTAEEKKRPDSSRRFFVESVLVRVRRCSLFEGAEKGSKTE